ncbi:MAG TPA: isoprenylcysteine carboxylmethyltransferase family protein [Candidatus Ozemobacteraceae bacterium]|nr:isoprenylcysteine carboxylmethyltransferase family protein [Candidatus Ozemobacteraceae bacterium]
MNEDPAGGGWLEYIGGYIFRWRDLLPVPLALLLIARARKRPLARLLALPLLAAGELLRLAALRHIGPTTRTREICADRLVTSGPYAWVRHPLYLANALKIAGMLLFAGDLPAGILSTLFYVLEFSTMIPYEEAFLKGKFPESFESWAARTPAFIPCRPETPEERPERTPKWSWGEACWSERRTFASTGLILLSCVVAAARRRE